MYRAAGFFRARPRGIRLDAYATKRLTDTVLWMHDPAAEVDSHYAQFAMREAKDAMSCS